MATEVVANRAVTNVTSGGSTAPAGGTVETWTVVSSTGFPAAATGVTQFHVADSAQPTELIAVTNVSGTTWTVTRGDEGTTPVAHAASGFTVYLVVTAGFLNGLIPAGQSYAQVSGTYTPLFSVQGTGGTDTTQPFQIVVGAGTYGTSPAVLGPVLAMGYNAANGMSKASNAHGAAVASFFADAGDTNVAGAHGIELTLSFFTADASKATAAFQLVAVDDNTNTVNTSIRCGAGTSSAITFQNGDASTTFAQMSNANSNVSFFQPVVFQQPLTFIDSAKIIFPLTVADSTGNSSAAFSSMNTGATAALTLNGTNATTASMIQFGASGVVRWAVEHTPPYLFVRDVASSRSALYFYPGATPAGSKILVNSVIQGLSSIVGAGALATNATDGFLYLPSCPGAPTGTPTAWTGNAACVFDSTDNKIYVFNGTWKSVTVA